MIRDMLSFYHYAPTYSMLQNFGTVYNMPLLYLHKLQMEGLKKKETNLKI